MEPVHPFPLERFSQMRPPDPRIATWLIEQLWAAQAVGCIGGIPKLGKTWLALELAVAVASGTPALGRFAVPRRGQVLVYCAEDGPLDVRGRLEALCQARGLPFEKLPIDHVAVPDLMLDHHEHTLRLEHTIRQHKPALLLLDPMVRLFRGDENSSQDVSRMLSFLRGLQRNYGLAIMLVHHVRKSAAAEPGQALRGSGDLHAWGDSNLYLGRRDDALVLIAEHRGRPAPAPSAIRLEGAPPRFVVLGAAPERTLDERALDAIATRPMTRTALRELLGVRNELLGEALVRLHANGRVDKRDGKLLAVVPA